MTAIIVHGGADDFWPEWREAAWKCCEGAATAGQELLSHGGSALDAVERAVQELEDAAVFNAGTGAYPNADGEVELDAIIVDGSTGKFGAVAGVQHVRHPIGVARAVLERTDHNMLAGVGATRFASEQGFDFVATDDLVGEVKSGSQHGTVGAVALDSQGVIAAATSTGGPHNKLPGRVGDSPLIGCGAMADSRVGGASATGDGESLMRVMMARAVFERIRDGMSAMDAAQAAVHLLKKETGKTGGIVCVDRLGRLGHAHNTPHLAYALIDAGGVLSSGL